MGNCKFHINDILKWNGTSLGCNRRITAVSDTWPWKNLRVLHVVLAVDIFSCLWGGGLPFSLGPQAFAWFAYYVAMSLITEVCLTFVAPKQKLQCYKVKRAAKVSLKYMYMLLKMAIGGAALTHILQVLHTSPPSEFLLCWWSIYF